GDGLMSWARYQPPSSGRLPQEHGDLFDRPAANGPHPWPFGRATEDPAPALAAELAALREQARAEGLAAALEDARATAAAETEAVRARWAAGLEALVRQTLEVADEHRRELVDLAIAVAESVLQSELERGAAIDALVGAGMTALGRDEDAVLALSTEDAARVAGVLRERWPKLTVRVDATLQAGAIRLESRAGRLDASIAERLARARALVLGQTITEGEP
ncbi:MAG TPA: FliH/SctL family protein, partial [Nannocystaceae bacterium]|nr:FliH/SctL family protein [Nannocystaceae bacterium]